MTPTTGKRMKSAGSFLLVATLAIAGAALAQDEEVVTKQYDDGGVYEGTFQNGLQHGTGTYRLPNGYEYTGDWVEGEIRGEGVARFQAAAVGSAPRPDGGRRRVPPRARATASPRSHARAYPIARRRRGRTAVPARSHAAVRPDGPSGAAATLAYSV